MDETTTVPQNLSVTDLAVIKNIIDLAAERGAFRAGEMQTVGEVYNKLTAFLTQIVAQAEAAEAMAKNQGDVK